MDERHREHKTMPVMQSKSQEIIAQREKDYAQVKEAVQNGESVMIVGLTHSGKSTIIKKCSREFEGLFGQRIFGFIAYNTSDFVEVISDEMAPMIIH